MKGVIELFDELAEMEMTEQQFRHNVVLLLMTAVMVLGFIATAMIPAALKSEREGGWN